MALSSNGRFLLNGTYLYPRHGRYDDVTIEVREVGSGKQVASFTAKNQGVSLIHFSRDGKLLLTAGGNPVVNLFKTPDWLTE